MEEAICRLGKRPGSPAQAGKRREWAAKEACGGAQSGQSSSAGRAFEKDSPAVAHEAGCRLCRGVTRLQPAACLQADAPAPYEPTQSVDARVMERQSCWQKVR